MAIDINSLFQDILETPEQRREKMLAQGAAQGQLATSNLTGLAASASPLIQAIYQNMPQRNEAMRTAVGGLLGKDLRTTSDKVQEAMSRFNPLDPQSVVSTTNMLRQMGMGTQAAQLAAMAAEERRNQDALARESALRNLKIKQIEREMDSQTAEAQRSAMWRSSVAEKVANNPQYAGWEDAIRNGSMPSEEVNRIASDINVKPTMDIVQAYVDGQHMSLHSDGEGGYYDMAMKPVSLGADDTVFKGSVAGSINDMAGLSKTARAKIIEDAGLTASFISSTQNVIDAIRANPGSLTTLGSVAGLANTVKANVDATLNTFKITGTDRPATELNDISLYPESFRELGIQNAEQQSLLLGVALQFAAISGQGEARSLSDQDVKYALQRVGAGQEDDETAIRLLESAQNEAENTFKIKYRFSTGNEYTGSLRPQSPVNIDDLLN